MLPGNSCTHCATIEDRPLDASLGGPVGRKGRAGLSSLPLELQFLGAKRFASMVSTTGMLVVPSGRIRDWKIMRAWFPLLS